MKIQQLQALYERSPKVRSLVRLLDDASVQRLSADGLHSSAAPLILGTLSNLQTATSPFVFVLNDSDEAGYFYHDLSQLLGEERTLFFPSSYRRQVKYGQRDAANEILRTEVLSRLTSRAERLCVVTYPEAVAELVVSQQALNEMTLQIHKGEMIDMTFVEETLFTFGFHREDYVYEPGQFAVRGSIIDVFSFSGEYPFRIDFFGDEVESIRTFDVQTQLSKERRDVAEIVPEMRGAKSDKMPFLQFLPEDTLLVAKDFGYVAEMIHKTYEEGFSQQALNERLAGATEMEQEEIYKEMRREVQLITGEQFEADAAKLRQLTIPAGKKADTGTQARVTFAISPQPLFHKNFDMLADALADYINNGYTIYICADSHKQQERLQEILQEKAAFTPVDHTIHEGFADNDLRVCFFTDHQIFDRYHKYNLRSEKARSGKVALSLKELSQFQPGDLVVHVDHGIGRFEGLVRVPVNGPAGSGKEAYQEMIKLTYQNNDTVYVSIHALYKVAKYRGRDNGEPVRLSRLGTGAWENMKERTKKKIKDIARDLILLYSKRKQERGFAFSADSYLQHELEASFLYEDTPDQLRATADVKADMERARPMDRLVCGDVGFGKTEVAVRAAFKAACDSKQVAVLVPTTVLAFQHYQTFSSRLKGMPVRVEYLSRARSAKKTKEVLQDLEAGKVDIIIGTHKLISKTVKFHDLGLLIIDEEQKFGVSVKEKLRTLKTNVDTLTMSATPIPRTLQFSLMGARDLSVIQTPPPNRHPIQTEVHLFSAEVIADAINFEMSRNGQVFFVSNRISSLPELETLIHKHVPDARVAIGHGRTDSEELERIIMDFANYEYDVLLSTTIVENGIDIPNANTIIINSAQNFGLSDLHQMRGRVGRGNKKAFCYLLAPPLSALSTEARRRLEAIENFSDLGSGIHLAMQDLDIRGAGNLLGSEQSGFIADLGYETYQKILNEAVTELRNETNIISTTQGEENTSPHPSSKGGETGRTGDASSLPEETEDFFYVDDCSLDTDIEMYFPDSYVPSSSERMLLYRELDNTRDDDALSRFRDRLVDRFGPVPAVGEDLMRVVQLRRMGKELGIERIVLKQQRMSLYFVSRADSPYYQSAAFGKVLDYIGRHARTCQLKELKGKRLMSVANVTSVAQAITLLASIIDN